MTAGTYPGSPPAVPTPRAAFRAAQGEVGLCHTVENPWGEQRAGG